jgi:hypothetical protein
MTHRPAASTVSAVAIAVTAALLSVHAVTGAAAAPKGPPGEKVSGQTRRRGCRRDRPAAVPTHDRQGGASPSPAPTGTAAPSTPA